MRNTFYPQDKAEYMTTRKMAAEGLHPRGSGGDTAKRDRRFVPPDADSLLGGPNQEGGEDGDSALADLAGARFETIRVETPSAVTVCLLLFCLCFYLFYFLATGAEVVGLFKIEKKRRQHTPCVGLPLTSSIAAGSRL